MSYRRVDSGLVGGTPVAGKTRLARADDRVDRAVYIDHADALVFLIGDVHASEWVEGSSAWQVDRRLDGRAAVAAVGALARAADRLDIVGGKVVAQDH